MIHEITFEKFERNCPWNKEPGRQKVYDFRVLIDGVYRAYFTEGYLGSSRLWELRNVDDTQVKYRPESKLYVNCRFQNKFLDTVKSNLDKIATPEQIVERRQKAEEERQRYAAEAKAEEEAEARRQRLDAAQDELLAAAKNAVEAMCNMRQGRFQGATARLQKVIDQIEGK